MENKIIMEVNNRKDTKRVVTVILANRRPSKEQIDLHCLYCGRIVCQPYVSVDSIIVIEGEVRRVAEPNDVQCSRCKTIVRIA